MGGEKDAVREEERERSAGLHSIAKISRKHTSPSFILLHFPAPSTGLRAMACLSFLSISCSIGPWGGGGHFVSRKTGCVYSEMRKTLLRELSHRNSFLPRLLLTAMCMHILMWSENPQNTQHILPRFQRIKCTCTHTLRAFA